ncbi:hypothetical protein JCM10908_002451 [Rhodotorula pacifica]|uniref:ribonuclease H2 catalytic subunit RNH201 n=1 Tax=Rhodotorula pacifica TaxID=1495444 RepID=UPI003171C132
MAGKKRSAPTRSPSPAAEDGPPPPKFHFPSVRRGQPLIDTYTFHSVDPVVAVEDAAAQVKQEGKGKERETEPAEVEGDWMLGVDEAGRGPALGPQVYGVAYCKLDYSDELKQMGFADSKTLTDPLREELFKQMLEHGEDVKYAATIMSPNDISMGMLRKTPYNLNAQSHDCTINLIREVCDRGYKIKECYVDTVGPAADYQTKLSSFFPSINFTVTSKADALFPIVSAASIVAKVTRDRILDEWMFMEPGIGEIKRGEEGAEEEGADEQEEEDGEEEEDTARLFGSGYPSDPKTVAWLQSNFNPIFGFPNVARFSWAPVRNALLKKGIASKWNDEPATIQKYFAPDSAFAKGPAAQAPLWKDLSLVSVGEF